MQCPSEHGDNAGILLDFCARRLSSAQTLAVERHLLECSRCRESMDAHRSFWNLMGEWQAPEVSPDFDRRLFDRLERQQDRGWRARIAGWIRLTWKPAIPVLLTAATALTFILVREPAPVPVPAPQSAAVDGVDLNQVEQTLDDLNMLHQLSPTSSQSL